MDPSEHGMGGARHMPQARLSNYTASESKGKNEFRFNGSDIPGGPGPNGPGPSDPGGDGFDRWCEEVGCEGSRPRRKLNSDDEQDEQDEHPAGLLKEAVPRMVPGPADSYCASCDLVLCEDCSDSHNTHDHELRVLEDMGAEAEQRRKHVSKSAIFAHGRALGQASEDNHFAPSTGTSVEEMMEEHNKRFRELVGDRVVEDDSLRTVLENLAAALTLQATFDERVNRALIELKSYGQRTASSSEQVAVAQRYWMKAREDVTTALPEHAQFSGFGNLSFEQDSRGRWRR